MHWPNDQIKNFHPKVSKCIHLLNCSIQITAARERTPLGVLRSIVCSIINMSSMNWNPKSSTGPGFLLWPGFARGKVTSFKKFWVLDINTFNLSWIEPLKRKSKFNNSNKQPEWEAHKKIHYKFRDGISF